MTNNINVKMPPFLPTAPLPINMVTSGMMYMYSCSQCDFKTHIESMFKQHVDSVHLGMSNVPNNVMLGQNLGAIATTVTAMSPSSVSAIVAANNAAIPQTVVMATPTPGSAAAAIINSVDKMHKCPKCGFLAPSKNQLTQHKRKFHGKAATAAATVATLAVNTYAAPATISTQHIQHPQPVATAVVTQQQQQHQTQQTNSAGKKTYSCSACGYSTTRRDGLSQHYDSVHLKIKNHQCELCPYAASQKGTLNRHVKLRHKKKDNP